MLGAQRPNFYQFSIKKSAKAILAKGPEILGNSSAKTRLPQQARPASNHPWDLMTRRSGWAMDVSVDFVTGPGGTKKFN